MVDKLSKEQLSKEQLEIIERFNKSAEMIEKCIARSIKGDYSKKELDHLITTKIEDSIKGRMVYSPPLKKSKIDDLKDLLT